MNTITVSKGGEIVLQKEIAGWSTGQRLTIQLSGGYYGDMPLIMGRIYEVLIHVDNLDDASFLSVFDGYFYNTSVFQNPETGEQAILPTQNALQFIALE